jgi:hypothetical protein
MLNTLLSVSGTKVQSLVINDISFRFIDKSYNSIEDFEAGWGKSLNLATKQEIKLDKIKKITSEAGDDDITLAYKGMIAGASQTFSFSDPAQKETFFRFMETELGYRREEETLTSFKAIQGQVGIMAFLLAVIGYALKIASDMEAGAYEATEGYSRSSRNARFFENIVQMLGTTGLIVAGLLVIGIFGYIIRQRLKNPPVKVTLFAPNAE